VLEPEERLVGSRFKQSAKCNDTTTTITVDTITMTRKDN